MTKILYICPQFLPLTGGLVSHVYNISMKLKDDYDITVYTVDFENLPSQETIEGLKIRRFKPYPNLKPTWIWSYLVIFQILNSLKKNRFDIIHIHSYTNFGPLVPLIMKKISPNILKNTVLIFTPHYHPRSTTNIRNIFRNVYDAILKIRIFRLYDIVITLTNYEKNILSSFCEENKMVVIPNGIDLDDIGNIDANHFRFKYGIKNCHYVLYVGYLLQYKGVQTLISAMKNIIKSNSKLMLIVIGDGDYKKELMIQAKNMKIEKNVMFLGFLERTDMISAMKNCEILVLPSEYEAFGIVLLEAMACSKPVIASKTGGIPEIGIDENFLMKYGDTEELTRLISLLLDNSQLGKAVGTKNYQISKNYSWISIVKNLDELYMKALQIKCERR